MRNRRESFNSSTCSHLSFKMSRNDISHWSEQQRASHQNRGNPVSKKGFRSANKCSWDLHAKWGFQKVTPTHNDIIKGREISHKLSKLRRFTYFQTSSATDSRFKILRAHPPMCPFCSYAPSYTFLIRAARVFRKQCSQCYCLNPSLCAR